MLVGVFSLLVALSSAQNFQTPVVGAYFPNWAQYRQSPYTYTPDNLQGALQYVNMIWYAFAYFCPAADWTQPYWTTQLTICQNHQPMEITQPEPKDTQFYQQIIAFKNSNPDLKVLLSIGGWNFPSAFWSGMVASSSYRQTFIQSCLSTMEQYGFDGIDIDWEYPCSPPRKDPVKITCSQFDYTTDDGGGSCSQDSANLLTLVQEMRQAFGSKYLITVAAQADMKKATDGMQLSEMSKYIDLWNLMSYDYSVSDIDNANITAINEPLYPPASAPDISQDCVKTTIDGYLNQSVPASQINVGIAYYGHGWYVPGMSNGGWDKFGLSAQIQGDCCLDFKTTYGCKYGEYSQLCGTYMYSEIVAAGFDIVHNNETGSDIGYMISPKDSYTSDGVWMSFQGPDTISEIVAYAKSKNLVGAFAFDISMDTVENGRFTYDLTKQIYQEENS